MSEVFLLVAPSLALILGWVRLRKKRPSRRIFLSFWMLLVVALAVTGALIWSEKTEGTRFASALATSSTIYLSGPFLAWTLTKQWHPIWSWIASLVLPIASMVACAAFLLATHQIWGM